MTLQALLEEGIDSLRSSGVLDAELDARLLLFSAFRTDMVHFLMDKFRTLPENEETKQRTADYRRLIQARGRRFPLQYLLGEQDFMGLPFKVSPEVLIPRQDTETMVELILEEHPEKNLHILDLCTGSGCIAVSLKRLGAYEIVDAADLSEKALQIAKENAEINHVPEISFYQGNLFEALPEEYRCDLIVSNPPYIPSKEIETLEPEVKEFEPRLALDGEADGLSFYRRIAKSAGKYLSEEGSVYLEIGYDQGEAVKKLLEEKNYTDVRVIQDLAGKDRIVCGKKSKEDSHV